MELEASLLPPRLLLVDDSPANLRFLAHLLRDMGELYVATRGDEALDMARDRDPDLILLDVEMPGMNGYEVCRALKKDPGLAAAAVMFVTSHQSIEHEVTALEAGAVDFVSRPINPPVLRARVKTHLTLKQQSDTLRQLANRDGMTGVFNRRAFDGLLETEYRRHLRSQFPLGMAMLDVDWFKNYNDCCGHLAGDDCLRIIADTIVACSRRPAESVCRYGGEEFVILLPHSTTAQVVQYAENLRARVEQLALPHKGSSLQVVTISIGCATWIPLLEMSASELIRRCDLALYQAKNQGRNRVCLFEQDGTEPWTAANQK